MDGFGIKVDRKKITFRNCNSYFTFLPLIYIIKEVMIRCLSNSILLYYHHHRCVCAGDIADTLLNNLLDLKLVFSRIDSAMLCSLLVPSLTLEVDLIVKKEGTASNGTSISMYVFRS